MGYQFQRQKVSDKSEWYSIVDESGNEYGLFSLTTVIPQNPQYTKHLDLVINQKYAEDIIENDNFPLLIAICEFSFESVLEITDDNNMNKCKIRARDDLVLMIYTAFAESLRQNHSDYEVTSHGRWIIVKSLKTIV